MLVLFSAIIRRTKDFVFSESDNLYIWEIEMPPQGPPGLSCSLQIKQGLSFVQFNIIFGDVWLCSGQSNMNIRMEIIENMQAEKAKAINKYSNIHMYR
jgi:sialate O-acetylesterase